jgi:hypothetical protein
MPGRASVPMGRPRRSLLWQRCRGLAVLFALPLLVSCGAPTQPSDVAQDGSPGTGLLTGSVLRGPTTSVVVPGATSSVPVAGAKVVVSTPGGGEAGSGTTGADGIYRVPLASGTYVVTLTSGASFLFTKDLPATVNVAEGQTTTLNVMLDTGIR